MVGVSIPLNPIIESEVFLSFFLSIPICLKALRKIISLELELPVSTIIILTSNLLCCSNDYNIIMRHLDSLYVFGQEGDLES